MLKYDIVKRDRRKLLALTGLTVKEFKALLPPFTEAEDSQWSSEKTLAGHKRQRSPGGGRPSQLDTVEQKLLFILVYQKTYPLQVVMAELFEMSQSGVNHWIHRLLPILGEALNTLGVMPEREGEQLAASERRQAEAARDYIIDGTERRRQRPKSSEKQADHYSGKKKTHSDKNIVVVQTGSKRVAYLSPTYAGKTHDKKMAECEQIAYPRRSVLRQDTGFQGYESKVKDTHQSKKSRAAKS